MSKKTVNNNRIILVVLFVILITLFGLKIYFDQRQRMIDNCKDSNYFSGHIEKCMKIIFSRDYGETEKSNGNIKKGRLPLEYYE